MFKFSFIWSRSSPFNVHLIALLFCPTANIGSTSVSFDYVWKVCFNSWPVIKSIQLQIELDTLPLKNTTKPFINQCSSLEELSFALKPRLLFSCVYLSPLYSWILGTFDALHLHFKLYNLLLKSVLCESHACQIKAVLMPPDPSRQ